MHENQEFQISVFNKNRLQNSRIRKMPKWLSCYTPKVTVNSPEYHFISQPSNLKHQRVSVKNSQTSRPIMMYFEIDDIHEFTFYQQKEDHSKLKSFEHLNGVEYNKKIILNKEQFVRDSIWAKKYEPKLFFQLLTEEFHNRNVLIWLKSWDWIVFRKEVPNMIPLVKYQKSLNAFSTNYNKASQSIANDYNHNRLLLLSGPPGCGKTTLARVVARHCGYDVMQLNASDDRSGKVLIQKIEALGKNNSVRNGKPIMIIVDEVDGALQQDGNGVKEVLAYIQSGGKQPAQKRHHKSNAQKSFDVAKTQSIHQQKHTQIPRPIIFICNDPYVKGLKQLRSKAIVVYFRQIQKQKIARRLKQIAQKQKIYIENQIFIKIAQIAGGDIRSSLSILEYLCNAKKYHNQNPRDLINKLQLSFQKDSATSINEFVSQLLNQTRTSSLKKIVNLNEFSYTVSKIDNYSLLFQMFFHNIILYKNFFIKRTKQTIQLYDTLKWFDVLISQSFKYGGDTDFYQMMVLLFYKIKLVNDQLRKIQFPTGFFERLSKHKYRKDVISQLIQKWPAFLKSTVSRNTVIKQYIWLLFYAVQTASLKDSDIIDCVGRMITYNIELAPENSQHLFKPQFETLLAYGNIKLESLYTAGSRSFIQQSYEFAKLKSYLLTDMSLTQLNKNTSELMNQLSIRNRKRKRNPDSTGKNSIRYKFVEGSGTQITYDLKFKYFFE